MTISLEEHVARAMALINRPGMRWEQRGAEPEAVRQEYFAMARAAIAAVREYEGALTKDERRQFAINFVHEGQRPADPAEAMRAKCEEIAREMPGWQQPRDVADAIAALKDNGERK